MAKARATCTCATCGREFEVTSICSNRRGADSWAAWASDHYDECSDCYNARIQRERDEANAAAKAAAEDAGLPELTGSAKQVTWANTIRQGALKKLAEEADEQKRFADQAKERGNKERYEKRLETWKNLCAISSWMASEKTAAHWWIDNARSIEINGAAAISYWVREEFSQMLKSAEIEKTEAPLREAAQQETTAEPENKHHEGRVEITVGQDMVSAKYAKNDDFRALVKGLGYTWDSESKSWVKRIGVTTGSAKERAAELGNKLLNAGFAICIADPETLQAAIGGNYEPQHMRWITKLGAGKYAGYFCVTLQYGDGMYERAIKINGAKYSKPYIVVPASEYAAIEDFANLYDYKLSPGATDLIKEKKASIIIVAPAPVKSAVYDERDPSEILKSSKDILDDLIDD